MNAKQLWIFLTMSILLWFSGIYAQDVDPLDFFPHHAGDTWEYYEFDYGMLVDTVQNVIIKDSLGQDGRYYINQTLKGTYILNTTNYEVHYKFGTSVELRYKLDSVLGDSWVVHPAVNGIFGVAHVIDEFSDILFNQPTIVKIISYYSVNTTVNDSLWLGNHYLASGFGLVGEDWDLGGAYRIKGAVIDSIKYGTVTAIKEPSPIQLPQNAVLYQNYPNPFNPVTMIPYQLSRTEEVALVVYDLLGRKVATLVNEIQTPGSYQIHFDGQHLSSGVYIYQLSTLFEVLVRKMILSQ